MINSYDLFVRDYNDNMTDPTHYPDHIAIFGTEPSITFFYRDSSSISFEERVSDLRKREFKIGNEIIYFNNETLGIHKGEQFEFINFSRTTNHPNIIAQVMQPEIDFNIFNYYISGPNWIFSRENEQSEPIKDIQTYIPQSGNQIEEEVIRFENSHNGDSFNDNEHNAEEPNENSDSFEDSGFSSDNSYEEKLLKNYRPSKPFPQNFEQTYCDIHYDDFIPKKGCFCHTCGRSVCASCFTFGLFNGEGNYLECPFCKCPLIIQHVESQRRDLINLVKSKIFKIDGLKSRLVDQAKTLAHRHGQILKLKEKIKKLKSKRGLKKMKSKRGLKKTEN